MSLGLALRFQNPTPGPVALLLCLLPGNWDVKLLATGPESCLSASQSGDSELTI